MSYFHLLEMFMKVNFSARTSVFFQSPDQCFFQEFCGRAKVTIIHNKMQQMWQSYIGSFSQIWL